MVARSPREALEYVFQFQSGSIKRDTIPEGAEDIDGFNSNLVLLKVGVHDKRRRALRLVSIPIWFY